MLMFIIHLRLIWSKAWANTFYREHVPWALKVLFIRFVFPSYHDFLHILAAAHRIFKYIFVYF